jgi:aldehyde:ferredoxin oxidoreductase
VETTSAAVSRIGQAMGAKAQAYTVADLQRIGERRLNLARAFNAREGAGRERSWPDENEDENEAERF